MVRTWAVYGFGMAITDSKEIEQITELNGFTDPCELVDIDGWYYNEDVSDCLEVDYTTDEKDYDNKIDLSEMLVFYAKKQPRVFRTAYADINEVVEEFKGRGIKLPENFDIASHIGYFNCTCCG